MVDQYFSGEEKRIIFAIDSKSFYASVESRARGLNPLRSCLIVVSTGPNVGGGGLILATSPIAKLKYGLKSNVSRLRDLPDSVPDLKLVSPRMNFYIHVNMQINGVYRKYVSDKNLHIYSIDESFLDVTDSWHLFGKSPIEVARKIQADVLKTTGIYTTIGIGDNLAQAKIAMDIYGKHSPDFIGEIHYLTVAKLLWPIKELDSVWSIGKKTALKLNDMGIYSLNDLAHSDPYILTKKMGVIGGQLYLLSWGIDRAVISKKSFAKSKSYGNSQVLPKNYTKKSELAIVLRELSDQVAARIRKHHLQAGLIHVWVGNEYKGGGFSKQTKIIPTNESKILAQVVLDLFFSYWPGDPVRNVSIYFSDLVSDDHQQLDFFRSPESQIKSKHLDNTVDKLRLRYGFSHLVKASSTLPGGTAIERSNLVGGHNGGNSYE